MQMISGWSEGLVVPSFPGRRRSSGAELTCRPPVTTILVLVFEFWWTKFEFRCRAQGAQQVQRLSCVLQHVLVGPSSLDQHLNPLHHSFFNSISFIQISNNFLTFKWHSKEIDFGFKQKKKNKTKSCSRGELIDSTPDWAAAAVAR